MLLALVLLPLVLLGNTDIRLLWRCLHAGPRLPFCICLKIPHIVRRLAFLCNQALVLRYIAFAIIQASPLSYRSTTCPFYLCTCYFLYSNSSVLDARGGATARSFEPTDSFRDRARHCYESLYNLMATGIPSKRVPQMEHLLSRNLLSKIREQGLY